MGGLHGVVPGGFLNTPVVESADYPDAFKAGFGAGEMAWGITQILAGGGGEVIGTGLAATGSGALAGVPLSVASSGIIAEGAADVAAGAQIFRSAITEGGHGTETGEIDVPKTTKETVNVKKNHPLFPELEGHAKKRAAELKATMSNRKRGPVLTVLKDKKTG